MNQPKAINPFDQVVDLSTLGVPGIAGRAMLSVDNLLEISMLAEDHLIYGKVSGQLLVSLRFVDGKWTPWNGTADITDLDDAFTALVSDLAKSPDFGTWFLQALVAHTVKIDIVMLENEMSRVQDLIDDHNAPEDIAELANLKLHESTNNWMVSLSELGLTNDQLARAQKRRPSVDWDIQAIELSIP